MQTTPRFTGRNATQRYMQWLVDDAARAVSMARIQSAILRGELVWTPKERIARLAARASLHRAAGRLRAYAACKRMAQRIVNSLPE